MYKVSIATISARTGEILTLNQSNYKTYIDAIRILSGLISYYHNISKQVELFNNNYAIIKLNSSIVKSISIDEIK